MRQVTSSCGTGYDARVRAMRAAGIEVTEHDEQFSGRRTAFVSFEDFEKANEICLRPSLRYKERKINKGWRKR